MEQRVAIVTGGLRGLGRAMAFGLAREGHSVLAVGHIDSDVVEVATATAGGDFAGHILSLVADLRRPADCDRVVAMGTVYRQLYRADTLEHVEFSEFLKTICDTSGNAYVAGSTSSTNFPRANAIQSCRSDERRVGKECGD